MINHKKLIAFIPAALLMLHPLAGVGKTPDYDPRKDVPQNMSNLDVLAGESPIDNVSLLRSKPVIGQQTHTFIRCQYKTRTGPAILTSDYVWATTSSGAYRKLYGSWWKGNPIALNKVFYTNESKENIQKYCEDTLARKGIQTEILTPWAANNIFSTSDVIWSGSKPQVDQHIERVVVFGDSLSDTGNAFNNSLGTIPNKKSWYHGRFTNGQVWHEYLAKILHTPVYSMAVGGAATSDAVLVIPGLDSQIAAFRNVTQGDYTYQIENTLFTIFLGNNDIIKYDIFGSDNLPENMLAKIHAGLQELTDIGAKHIVIMNLPDLSKVPVVKNKGIVSRVEKNVRIYNDGLTYLAEEFKRQGVDVKVFDTEKSSSDIFNNIHQYGIVNADTSCLSLLFNDSPDLFLPHSLKPFCALSQARYFFWDSLHPTTQVHELLAKKVAVWLSQRYAVKQPENSQL